MRKLTVLFFIFPFLLGAQSIPDHFRFNPAGLDKTWSYVSSEHFDVHFYAKDPVLASQVARFAEQALYEISDAFDYKPRNPFNIYLYLDAFDLIRSNHYPDNQEHIGGITPVFFNSAPVVYEGNVLSLHQDIKTAVTRMVMNEFYFGTTISSSVQNTLFLYQPQWFSDGLSRYMGEGWTIKDETEVAGLDNEDILNLVIEGDQIFNQTLRKSIWYFIAENYGKEKLSEIFYMARLHHSVEAAIIRSLGIKLETLTERWREFLLQRISENEENREDYKANAKYIALGKGDNLLGFSMNPSKPLAAVLSWNNGKVSLSLYDTEKGGLEKNILTEGWKNPLLADWHLAVPVAWNHAGDKFVCVFPGKEQDEFLFYDHTTGNIKRKPVQPQLDKVYSVSWSHEDALLALSGLTMGTTDVFTMTPTGDKLTRITDDLYDNTAPFFTEDDQLILYGSNKPAEDTLKDNFIYTSWASPADIFSAPANGAGDHLRITLTPDFSEFPAGQPSGYEALFLTDEAGVINLAKRNLFIPDSSFLTNITRGFIAVSHTPDQMLFSVSEFGKPALYFAKTQEYLSTQVVLNSRLRHTMARDLLERRMKQEEADRILREREKRLAEEKKKNESKIKVEENKIIVPDSAKSDSLPVKTKFYVFDEDEDSRPQKKTKVVKREKIAEPVIIQTPDFSQIVLKGPERSGTRWATDKITMRFGYDPVFKLYMQFEGSLTDTRGNKQFSIGYRPYIDRKSCDFFARMDFRKGNPDWYLGIDRMGRFINKADYEFRYHAVTPRAGVSLPLNHYTAVSGTLKTPVIRRIQLDPFAEPRLDGAGFFPVAETKFEIDRRRLSGSFTKGGHYFSLKNTNAFKTKGNIHCFSSLQSDFRKYFAVGKSSVIALRLAGGMSLGKTTQRFYLGGVEDALFSHFGNTPDFSMDKELQGFYFSEYITPIRGFLYNARMGSKYLAANLEIRVPMSRLGMKSLNASNPNNVEFIPFLDFGTAWTEGNPFSQKNPINTQIIDQYPFTITVQTLRSPFVVGFGSGLRLNVFGYSARVDLAWGIEDYDLTSPKVHISLGKNF